MSRNGKPAEIKELQGTANKTRERRKSEPRFGVSDQSIPLAPHRLSEKGKEIWGRVALQLHSVGLFFPSVYEYLERYCLNIETMEKLWIEIDGSPLDSGAGTIKPAYKAYMHSVNLMMALGSKLGLSPQDKTRISTQTFVNTIADKNKNKSLSVGGKRIRVDGGYD